MEEIWKNVPGYENVYQVSNLGRVKSLRRRCVTKFGNGWYKEKILKPQHAKGRLKVCLSGSAGSRLVFIHRLVLFAFIGDCPENMEACHNDGNPSNNNLNNLRWDTHTSNMRDCDKHGTRAKGDRNGCSKLTNDDVKMIKVLLLRNKMTSKELSNMFNVTIGSISNIRTGRKWSHITNLKY